MDRLLPARWASSGGGAPGCLRFSFVADLERPHVDPLDDGTDLEAGRSGPPWNGRSGIRTSGYGALRVRANHEVPQTRCTGPRLHGPSRCGDHSCPQYPQGWAGRRALQELREVPAGRALRDRADRANIYLNRRDVPFESARRVVIHRLLRCPAHTGGGVVVRPPFFAFGDLSTDDSTSVDNLNGG